MQNKLLLACFTNNILCTNLFLLVKCNQQIEKLSHLYTEMSMISSSYRFFYRLFSSTPGKTVRCSKIFVLCSLWLCPGMTLKVQNISLTKFFDKLKSFAQFVKRIFIFYFFIFYLFNYFFCFLFMVSTTNLLKI